MHKYEGILIHVCHSLIIIYVSDYSATGAPNIYEELNTHTRLHSSAELLMHAVDSSSAAGLSEHTHTHIQFISLQCVYFECKHCPLLLTCGTIAARTAAARG